MRGSRGALACALVLSAACSSRMPGGGSRREGPLTYAGPAGWEIRVLQQPPPYGLAQYVEPRTQGIPDASRGFLLVGKARVGAGSDPLGRACEDQWTTEAGSAIPPVERRALRVARGSMICVGWEAKRILPDGTSMRLRTLCGARAGQSVYLYLSAPGQSGLYEPMWENLLRLNVDQE
jgi:hypothetical protein